MEENNNSNNYDSYTLSLRVQIEGELQQDNLQESLNTIIKRHEILRTVFHEDRETVHDYSKPHIEQITTQDNLLHKTINEFSIANFYLNIGPLYKITIIRTNKLSHTLVIVFSHKIIDCYSALMLGHEIMTVYRDILLENEPLETIPNSYADFTNRENRNLTDDIKRSLRGYWANKLHGCRSNSILSPSLGSPKNDATQSGGHIIEHVLNNTLANKIDLICRESRVTLFAGLLTVLQSTLSTTTNQLQSIVYIPFSRRNPKLDSGAIGSFVHSLPICANINKNTSYADLLVNQGQDIFDAIEHSAAPKNMINEIICKEMNLESPPPVIVSQLITEQPYRSIDMPVRVTTSVRDGVSPNTRMVFSFIKHEADIQCNVTFNKMLVDRKLVEEILESFDFHLEQLCDDPSKVIFGQ